MRIPTSCEVVRDASELGSLLAYSIDVPHDTAVGQSSVRVKHHRTDKGKKKKDDGTGKPPEADDRS